jgi:hypothetical protein
MTTKLNCIIFFHHGLNIQAMVKKRFSEQKHSEKHTLKRVKAIIFSLYSVLHL